jgi:hypothetical protein
MRISALACLLVLSACGPRVTDEELVDDVTEPELALDGKADGLSPEMGTYRQLGGPAVVSLLRNGKAHTERFDGTYKLGATTLRIYDGRGTLRASYTYTVGHDGGGTQLALTSAATHQVTALERSAFGWCNQDHDNDCEPQNLEYTDCTGNWRCDTSEDAPGLGDVCQFDCYFALPKWDDTVGAMDCADAWAAGLHPCDATPDHYVVIHKSAHNLAECDRGELVKNHRIGLGLPGDKQWQGDRRTPEGTFYVGQALPLTEYRRALVLSYPTKEDGERGRDAGRLTSGEFNQIMYAHTHCTLPPQTTALGGMVEIHGHGDGGDWTLGCAALGNPEMDEVYGHISLGDTIVVVP